jgi:hypothetical protein
VFTARYGLKLCVIRVSIKLGHVVAQGVSCQPLTTEAPYDICRVGSDSVRDFTPSVSFFHQWCMLIGHTWLLPKNKWINTGDVSKNNARSEIGEHC